MIRGKSGTALPLNRIIENPTTAVRAADSRPDSCSQNSENRGAARRPRQKGMSVKMMEWIAISLGTVRLSAAENVVLYKWLLGGAIVLMALLGLVVCGMLALQVLQSGGDNAAGKALPKNPDVPEAEEPPADGAGDDPGEEETVTAGEAGRPTG